MTYMAQDCRDWASELEKVQEELEQEADLKELATRLDDVIDSLLFKANLLEEVKGGGE